MSMSLVCSDSSVFTLTSVSVRVKHVSLMCVCLCICVYVYVNHLEQWISSHGGWVGMIIIFHKTLI